MEKLKDVIESEIKKVTNKLLANGIPVQKYAVLKEWLQSLQRIDNVCKDRNRY